MQNIRLIARLDVKAPNLIKGIHLEGLRKLGDPGDFARRYYHDGVDEIIYIDTMASLYERNTIIDLISKTAENVFIPITVGGGVRSVNDARTLLRSGADKVAVNTAALKRPELITEISRVFGSQCVVLSIQAKQQDGGWEAYGDNGRERSGIDVIEWAAKGAKLGAGEILVTSIDREGTRQGFDLPLLQAITGSLNIPVIASGGMGALDHLVVAVKEGGADAVAMAHVLHYQELELTDIRRHAVSANLNVRICT